ncbi:MAG: hypothetical protein AUJ07_11460 [Crenarchaeota archaeon 13_1_40CM_3_53_5]|nr:MAG: hypothetical protein AUJ07_11460 [Crenarchaeota archaeon 13_1_40CM_3_53_5]
MIPSALALALFVLIVRQLAVHPSGDLIVGPDWRGPLYSLQVASNMFIQIFHDFYFGTDFPFSYTELLLGALASPNPALVNWILVAIPIPLSALTAYLFTLTRIRRDEYFAVVASLVYSVNPLTVSRLYSVEVLMLWVYALVPLFFFFVVDFKKRHSMVLAAIILNLMFALRPQAVDILALMLIGPLVFYLWPFSKLRAILRREGKSLARAIGFLIITFIPLNGPYIVKLLLSQTVGVSPSDVLYLYSNAGPWNSLRLAGEPSFYHAIFGFNDVFSIVNLVTLITGLVFIASSILTDRRNHTIRIWQYSFLAVLSLLTLTFFLRDALANFIVSSPVTGTLRNPDKFLFALVLPFSLIVAHGSNCLRLRASMRIGIPQWNGISRILMVGLMIALVLMQNYPLVTTNLYSPQDQPSIRNSYWEDPQSWTRYNSVLDSLGTYRVLVLPYTYGVETAARTILSAYPIVSIPPGEIGAKTGAVSYWSYLLDAVANNQSNIAYAMKMGGIRFVLVDDHLAESIGHPVSLDAMFLNKKILANGIIDNYLYLPPGQLISILNSQQSIRYVATTFGLHIFENMLYEGDLFAGQLLYSSTGPSTHISGLLNDSIITEDQSVARLASAKLVSPLATLDNATIVESRPQILPLSINASTENIGSTTALGNLAFTNSTIVFPSGTPGWASIDVVSPYGFAHQPSGVDQYNIFYKNSSGISTPVWNNQGFNDIALGGRDFPLAAYKSSVGGSSSMEGYSIGAQKLGIPPSFNYSSFPGLHKGFKIYLDGLPVTLDLGFYFQLDNNKTRLLFGMVSYLVNPGSTGTIDVAITPDYPCQIANPKLLSNSLSYNSVQEGYVSNFQGIVMGSNSQQYLFVTADNLSTCSGITTWLAPTGLIPRLERRSIQPLKVHDNGAEIIATFGINGPSVLFLAYAFDSAWTPSSAPASIHFQCFGMNCFILQSTGTSLLIRFTKDSVGPLLLSLFITATIASLAYFLLWDVRWNPLSKKKANSVNIKELQPMGAPQPRMGTNRQVRERFT